MKYLFFIFLLSAFSSQSQTKHTFKIDNYESDTVLIGNFNLLGQNTLDTLYKNKGKFVWENATNPKPGMYYILMLPKRVYLVFMVDSTKQNKFDFKIDYSDVKSGILATNEINTKEYFTYHKFKNSRIKVINDYHKINKNLDKNSVQFIANTKSIDSLNKVIKNYRSDIYAKYPNAIVSLSLKLFELPEPPENLAKEEKFFYVRSHLFDYVDFKDSRLIHAPKYVKKLNYYLDKMHYPQADSLMPVLDELLSKHDTASNSYQATVDYFLKKYKQGINVNQDKIYYHLLKNYVLNGKGYWYTPKEIRKFEKDYNIERFIKIGQKAPNVALYELDIKNTLALPDSSTKKFVLKDSIPILDVAADITLLFVWDPDCSHCKKAMPYVVSYYKKYKEKGIEIYAICNKPSYSVAKCAEYLDKNVPVKWLNMVDPYYLTKFKTIYDIRSTPKIFMINKQGKIIARNVKVSQLASVTDKILANKNKLKNKG